MVQRAEFESGSYEKALDKSQVSLDKSGLWY